MGCSSSQSSCRATNSSSAGAAAGDAPTGSAVWVVEARHEGGELSTGMVPTDSLPSSTAVNGVTDMLAVGSEPGESSEPRELSQTSANAVDAAPRVRGVPASALHSAGSKAGTRLCCNCEAWGVWGEAEPASALAVEGALGKDAHRDAHGRATVRWYGARSAKCSTGVAEMVGGHAATAFMGGPHSRDE